nr:methyltransferase [Metarhizium anisopliae polymycovirus 1]
MPLRNIRGAPRRLSTPSESVLPLRAPQRVPRSESPRSVSSSRDREAQAGLVQGAVPLTRIDFGQRRAAASQRELPADAAWEDVGGRRFMATELGARLRQAERVYARTTREVVSSLKKLRGSRILVLGCGSSRHLLGLAKAAPESMVFVDVSAPALARMSRLMGEAGYADVVDDEYACMDAWDYIGSEVRGGYDLVLITKCLGQVFKTAPTERSVHGILDRLQQKMAADGIVVVDHHNAFSTQRRGTPVTKVCGRGKRDLATIGGRFVDDVCYSADTSHHAYDKVFSWSSDERTTGVQEWTQFIYRYLAPIKPPSVGVVRPVHDVVPIPFRLGAMQDVNEDLDMIVPRSFNGVKRVPMESDLQRLDATMALPKFDGMPGTFIISGRDGIFLSSRYQLLFELCRVYTAKMVFAAELLHVGTDDAVIAIVGAFCIAEVECDPYSYRDLSSVAEVLKPLAADGVFVTSPAITTTINHDDLARLGPPSGRHIRLPVDGINVIRDGVGGEFVKAGRGSMCDLVVRDARALLVMAHDFLGLNPPSVEIAGGAFGPDSVVEFRLQAGDDEVWTPVNTRLDKRVSNTLGRTMVDVVAAHNAQRVFGNGGVLEVMQRLTQ